MMSELLITVSVADEKLTLTWHSYASHFQGVLCNLFDAGESSDVTLVCDDQVKFKAHKFVLKSCSPVFENILDETNDSKSVVYLRGVNQLELRSILNFIYSGQAYIYQERRKDFLKIVKDLQIKVIKDERLDIGESIAEKPLYNVISGEVLRDDNESDDKNLVVSSTARHESSTQISVPSDSSQCPQCNAVFKSRGDIYMHIRAKHEGVKYPCDQCDYKTTRSYTLKKHINLQHMC